MPRRGLEPAVPGDPWSDSDTDELVQLCKQVTTNRQLSRRFPGRSEDSIRKKKARLRAEGVEIARSE